jgi:hypothetical protein
MDAGVTVPAALLASAGSAGAVGGSMVAGAIGAGVLGVCAMAELIETMSTPSVRCSLARVWAESFMMAGSN